MKLISLFVILNMFLMQTHLVVAQESSNSAVLEDRASSVTFEQLRSDYLFQVEEYRRAEDRFNLDKAEFYKLGTLISREKAVGSMKPYLLARARVMSTYLVALEYLLEDMQGVDVIDRTQTLERSRSVRAWIRDYIATIDSLEDRDSVNASSEEFEANSWRIFEVQNRMLALISLGPVQVVFDQLELATEEFQTDYVEEIEEPGTKAVVERGMRDVRRENQEADQFITAARNAFYPFISLEEYDELSDRDKPNYVTMYGRMVENLQDSFSSMKQSVRYLKELERQL